MQSAFPVRLSPSPFGKRRAVTQWSELSRQYEAKRYPPTRRLELHGESAATARDRTLRWIQSFAHEQPGADLLLVVERARGRRGPVRVAVEGLLEELKGGLLEWWAPYGEGSLALRISLEPRMLPAPERPAPDPGDGRTDETAGAATIAAEDDVPPELLPLARRAAELRRAREGLPVSIGPVILRGIWIEAQAMAMTDRLEWEEALRVILAAEQLRLARDDDR